MKKVIDYQLKKHMVWNRKKYCPKCGNHEVYTVMQIFPLPEKPYFIMCSECGYDTTEGKTAHEAMKNWMENV